MTKTPRVIFATHAFWRDYKIVLAPWRFKTIIDSHKYDFTDRIIVLNNFRNHSEAQKARKMADHLVQIGLATCVLDIRSYLTDAVLSELGLNPTTYWTQNPYFSSSQFAAYHWAKARGDYILHMNGDVWLDQETTWIPRAIDRFSAYPKMFGFNLCRNIYRNLYGKRSSTPPNYSTEDFWVSCGLESGWGLSDLAYFIRLDFDLDFHLSPDELSVLSKIWPVYATPCFELYATAAIYRAGMCYGALKPYEGISPITRHKNFPKSTLKLWFYRILGKYQRGRFLTRR